MRNWTNYRHVSINHKKSWIRRSRRRDFQTFLYPRLCGSIRAKIRSSVVNAVAFYWKNDVSRFEKRNENLINWDFFELESSFQINVTWLWIENNMSLNNDRALNFDLSYLFAINFIRHLHYFNFATKTYLQLTAKIIQYNQIGII